MGQLARRELKGHGVAVDSRHDLYHGIIPGDSEMKDRVMHGLMLACESNRLADCGQKDVMLACYHAATLGMVPDTAAMHCHIIPYKKEAKFVMGYRGYIHLAFQSGMVDTLSVRLVYEADLKHGEFDVSYGTTNTITHKPYWLKEPNAERGEIVAAYCVWGNASTGASDFYVMLKHEIIAARDSSADYKYKKDRSIWAKHHEAMVKKTVVRHAAPFMPQGTGLAGERFAKAVHLDAKGEVGVSVVDDVPPEIILTQGNETIDPILQEAQVISAEMSEEEKAAVIQEEIDSQ